ncbi:MAG TPA: hypothetical protein VGK84_03295, partial [Candidatus Tumulicola sp.]
MRFVPAASFFSFVVTLAACSQQSTTAFAPSPAQIAPLLAGVHNHGTVGLWATSGSGGYVLGLSANGRTLVSSIATKPNCSIGPSSVKVDSAQNVWANCYDLGDSAMGGGMLEYNSSGTLLHGYGANGQFECPSGDACYFSSWDGGWDSKGHVFAELSDATDTTKNQGLTPGFFWWNAKKPANPTFIPAGMGSCNPICTIYHMDVDAHGNIWFDFIG